MSILCITSCLLEKVNFKFQTVVFIELRQLCSSLCHYSDIKSESLKQVHITVTEIQKFLLGLVFYW